MPVFEIITLTLSLVLGLSMSHLLWAAAAAVRAHDDMKLHWLPFLWAGCIFLAHVQYWFAAASIDAMIDSWSWSWYLHVLFLGVLLFASGALILPSASQQGTKDLLTDFREKGHLGLIPLAAYFAAWIPTNARAGWPLLGSGNYVNVALTGLLVVAIRSRRLRVKAVACVVFAAILVWATLFVWAPGVFTVGDPA